MALALRNAEPGPRVVARGLRDLAIRGDEVGGALSNYSGDDQVNAYLAWVSDIERALRLYFRDPQLDALYTTRHWQIRQLGGRMPRLHEVVVAEGSWQAERLKTLANELEHDADRFGADATATFAVIDTNVFLHCVPLEQINWSFVASGPIRLVVPIRVLEELDSKKRDRNSDISDRARKRIRWLRDLLVSSGGDATTLKDSTTIEAFVPSGPRVLQQSADTEILDACELLEYASGCSVVLVTSDLGMQLRGMFYRGRESGMNVVQVPDAYRLDLPRSSGGLAVPEPVTASPAAEDATARAAHATPGRTPDPASG